MKYHIHVFGCAMNVSDAERIAGAYEHKGWKKTDRTQDADEVVIVTCMIRQSAEDRILGLLRSISKSKTKNSKRRIILTGCIVGMAVKDQTGKMMANLHKRMPLVSEFLPIEDVGFSTKPIRTDKLHALVPISNGCNNYCSYCVVPFARGKEVSRPYDEIVAECKELATKGYTKITLVGQNVNSYGADLVKDNKTIKPVYVKHLGKMRIPTLFPHLLDDICHIPGLKTTDFLSSNPWDFSDELIDVIAKNSNILRLIHLPVQSGDEAVLKRMNRWYTPKQYLELIMKMRKRIPDVCFSTDIIVGFPGETKLQFGHTVTLCKKVGFCKAYISMYSDRPLTFAHTHLKDDMSYEEKKRRWEILDEMINKTNLRKGTYPLYE
jgi:tRNA-2-methylthio-N6-dimethylallyladenosine synthase